jgi:uncharacterized lipoprotein YajG
MKKLILLFILISTAGCGFQNPQTTALNPQISSRFSPIFRDATVSVQGEDLRKDNTVVIYRVKQGTEEKITALTPAIDVLTERLGAGLQSQGLLFDKDSPVRIKVELNMLVATITRPGLLYELRCISDITVRAGMGATTLIKKYNRENDGRFLRRPPVSEARKMLDDQLSDIMDTILLDEEIRKLIQKTG